MRVIRNKLVPLPMLNLLITVFSLFHSLPCSPTFLHTLRPADTDTLLPDTWHTAVGEDCEWLRVCVWGGSVYLDVAVCFCGDGNIAMVRKHLDQVVLITSRWCKPVERESMRWHADHTQPFRTGRHWNTQIFKKMQEYILQTDKC